MKDNEWPTPKNGWDVQTITRLLVEAGDFGDVDVTVTDNSVIQLTLMDRGDLIISMIPTTDQILASVLLIEESEVPNHNAFNKTILELHKAIPLSTFGLTTVNGNPWYELFGAISINCGHKDILEEVQMLASNAAEAAEWIEEWKKQYDAFPDEEKGE